jgi:hypothetical protein
VNAFTDALRAAAREFDPEHRPQAWTCGRHGDSCPRADRPSSRDRYHRLAATVGQLDVVMPDFEDWVTSEVEACHPATLLDRPSTSRPSGRPEKHQPQPPGRGWTQTRTTATATPTKETDHLAHAHQ